MCRMKSTADYQIKSGYIDDFIGSENILLVQDLDGVCIPLVKDPLTRVINKQYVLSASLLKEKYRVLTNGEHGGRRGVNKLVENAIGSKVQVFESKLYLPGLAAGGIQSQDNTGTIIYLGLSDKELHFLNKVPDLIREKLYRFLPSLIKDKTTKELDNLIFSAVVDTIVSPTLNLNGLFSIVKTDVEQQVELQKIALKIMGEILNISITQGMKDSFFLHIAPNLGLNNYNNELIKFSTQDDIGTTDIQFMVKGSVKESGLIYLINENIKHREGFSPFGTDFSFRDLPEGVDELVSFCTQSISKELMPCLIGVGDTVTSQYDDNSSLWLRGGSDRGFLFLIQELGRSYDLPNKVLLVDSSGGEVNRPTVRQDNLTGVSDPEDPLKFDFIFEGGPSEYLTFFNELAFKSTLK